MRNWRQILATALIGAGVAAAVVALAPAPAGATEGVHPVVSRCHQGWYVNPDEEKLLPKQVGAGFLFNGPSIVHHAPAAPTLLKNAATDGAFTTVGPVKGVKPLFKLETWAPYSTINKTADGKFWSSTIASGSGSQSMPLAHLTDFLGKVSKYGTYGDATTVLSFGVGYANDQGNAAIVSSITFAGTKYVLSCHPQSPSPSASVTATPSPTAPSPTATVSSSAGGGGITPSDTTPAPTPPGLPVTGPAAAIYGGAGAVLLAAGVFLFLAARRRRTRFEA